MGVNQSQDGLQTGTAKVYQEIQEFCELNRPSRGINYSQSSYKEDFFRLFVKAYRNQLCGWIAETRYERDRKQMGEKIDRDGYIISDASIERYLWRAWTKSTTPMNDRSMVSDLCAMWREWTYAWDCFPAELPPLKKENRLVQGPAARPFVSASALLSRHREWIEEQIEVQPATTSQEPIRERGS